MFASSPAKTVSEEGESMELEQKTILERMTDGLVLCDRAWCYTYINPAAARILQQKPEALLGKTFWQVFSDWVNTPIEQTLARSQQEQICVEFEEHSQSLNLWLEIRAYPCETGISLYFRDISDRKQIETALHESETRFRQLAENIEDVFWLWSAKESRHLYISPAYERIWGRSCESLYADPNSWIETVHPADRDRIRNAIQLCQQQETFQVEYRIVRPDNAVRWIRDRGFCIYTTSGIVERLVGISEDITDRKQTETALQESQELFLRFMQHSPIAAFMKDESGRYLYANAWIEQVYQCQQADLMGKTDFELLPLDVAQQFRTNDLAVLASGQPQQIVETIHTQEQEHFYLSYKFPFRDKTGQQILGGIAIEISEQLRAQASLRQQEEEFRLIINAVPAFLAYIDAQQRYRFANHAYESWFGISSREIQGRSICEVIGETAYEQIRPYVAQVLSGEPVSFETQFLHPDGEIRFVRASYTPQFDNAGNVDGFVVLVSDISDRIRTETALRSSAERLSLALQAANMGDWRWDATTDLVTFSEPAAEILGIPADVTLTWTQIHDLLHPEDRERAHLAVEQSIRDRIDYNIEYRVIRPDGTHCWIAVKGRTHYHPDKQVLGMIGIVQDVTERQQADQALRHTQEQLNLALKTFPITLFHQDRDLCYTWIYNPSFNYQQSDVIGKRDEDLIPSDDAAELTKIKQQVLQTGIRQRTEVKISMQNQDSFFDLTVEPLFNSEQAVIGIACAVVDITIHKRIEKALREREQRFSTLFNGMDDSVLVYHLTSEHEPGTFIEVNEAACQKLGYSRAELLTLSVNDLLGSPSLNLQTSIEKLLEKKHIVVESVHRTKDGRSIPLEVNATLFTLNGLPTVQAICRDISDRQQAEDALRKSERLYRAIGETINYGIWVCEPDGRNIYASESFLRLVGMTQEQCSSFGWAEVLHPDDAERTLAAWQECASSGDFWDIEHRFRGVDGTWHPILARGVPVRDENGETVCWAGINLDISRLKGVEAELRESEERFRLLADSAPVPIWLNGADGGCEFVNKEYLKFFGKTREEVMGFAWRASLHPDDEAEYLSAYLAAVTAREPFRGQARLKRADGQYRWLDSYALPRLSPTGEFLGYIGTSPDITEIQEASVALRQSDERFRLAAQAVEGVVYDWTLQSNTVYRSEGMYRVIGFHPDAVPQTQDWWTQRIHPDDLAVIEPIWRKMFTDENDRYDFEYRILHKAGHWVNVWDQGYLIRDGNGQVIRVVGSSTNITDRKRAEAEREQLLARERAAREAAEVANRIKDEFLAVLSHELRSPLNPILGWTKLLRSRKFDQRTTDQALETIERNARLQAQLIEDLLDVSRILRGKMLLNVTPVNLANTIQSALETVRLAAEAKAIQIQTSFDPNVGFVSGDSARLQQIIWNLLSNAIKFTPSGGRVEITLKVITDTTVTPNCEYAEITVSDTGKGISAEFLPYVFEYFRQEDGKTTRQFGGLGLGLAIVRYLSELHGGSVYAESAGEGLGATISVRLPLAPKVSITAPQTNPAQVIPESLPLAGLQILVVDDEPDMRSLMIAILESAGATVNITASAPEALKQLENSQPDIVVSDIGMPEIDGYTFLRQVRSLAATQGGAIPAIALTAYAGEINQQQALDAGFQMHLAKPVTPEALVEAIANLVGSSP